MKYQFYLILIILTIPYTVLSQSSEDSLNIYNENHLIERKKIYLNDEGMFLENVFEYQGKSANDLKGLVKNWGGITFNSFKNVIANETENQLVIRFNTNSYSGIYIKMVIDFKENKMRVRMFDEEARTFGLYFTNIYTNNEDLCCVNGNGSIKNRQSIGMQELVKRYVNLISISEKLNEFVLISSNAKKEDNW